MTIEPIDLAAPARRANARLVVERLTKTFGSGRDAVEAFAMLDL